MITLAELYAACRLDVVYEHAQGDWLSYRDGDADVRVLDLVGGAGASLCGHNHPALVAIARACLAGQWPAAVPLSVRRQAERLAERLAERVGRSTGREYVVTLAATGDEIVEAAIKHAELEAGERLAARRRGAEEGVARVRVALRHGARLPAELPAAVGKLLGLLRAPGEAELWTVLRRAAADAIARPPLFLAVEGAFHGRTTGALSFTHDAALREPWQRIGLRTRFLPAGDEAALDAALRAELVVYPTVDVDEAGQIRLVPARFANVAAAFAEPIQGEGGVRELSPVYLAALRRAADEHGFPLVLDELTSGLGRTGRFLAAEAARVRGDYVLLARALGGAGLAKVAALLVERERWHAGFARLHGSASGADDLSCAIGLGVLDLVDAEDVPRACHAKGDALLGRLRGLRERFPDELVGVRGRGLMIGVELGRLERSSSPLLRVLGEQSLLGWFAAGWFLREERVRVAPTAGSPLTLRVVPSAFVAVDELERFAAALERLLGILHDGRVEALVGGPAGGGAGEAAVAATPHAACLVPFATPDDLRAFDPRLSAWSNDACAALLARLLPVLAPFDLGVQAGRSSTGVEAAVQLIAVPPGRDEEVTLARVHAAIERARAAGASVVGLDGALAAFVPRLVEDELVLTTGAALAAAAVLERLPRAATSLGVVGAATPLGAVLAEVAADRFAELVLFGDDAALADTAAAIYESALRRLARGGEPAGTGVARALAALPAAEEHIGRETRTPRPVLTGTGARLYAALSTEAAAPVRVTSDAEAMRACPVVLAVGEAPSGMDSVRAEARVAFTAGPAATESAALAETLLLALERAHEPLSYGPLRAEHVRRAVELARRHGLTFAPRA